MCLAVPGKIVEINQDGGLRMCKVDFGGVIQDACIETLPEAKIGDYIIVHAGFALNVLSEEEAQETLEAFRQLEAIDAEIRAQEGG
ncbi:MAG: HypC/HybG/HupF family hydrogenase formation chaperone [Anaerolineaceae bacterium]|nr:HypC/HybG/HupF family hydrogenase formation chaperone [Anaerolineaceae bacterium]